MAKSKVHQILILILLWLPNLLTQQHCSVTNTQNCSVRNTQDCHVTNPNCQPTNPSTFRCLSCFRARGGSINKVEFLERVEASLMACIIWQHTWIAFKWLWILLSTEARYVKGRGQIVPSPCSLFVVSHQMFSNIVSLCLLEKLLEDGGSTRSLLI